VKQSITGKPGIEFRKDGVLSMVVEY